MPRFLRRRISNVAHYSVHAWHPGEHRIFDSLKRECYWPHMRCRIYTVIQDHPKCPGMCTKFNQQRKLVLLPPAGSFKFVAIDVWDCFPGPELVSNSLCLWLTGIPSWQEWYRLRNWSQPMSPKSSSMTRLSLTNFQTLCSLTTVSRFSVSSSHLYGNILAIIR